MPDSNSTPSVMATHNPSDPSAPSTPSAPSAPSAPPASLTPPAPYAHMPAPAGENLPAASSSAAPNSPDAGKQHFVLQVKYGGAMHHIRLGASASVGTIKQSLAQVTFVPPERQKLLGLRDWIALDPDDPSNADQIEATIVLGITLLGQPLMPAVPVPLVPRHSPHDRPSTRELIDASVRLAEREAKSEHKVAKMYLEAQRRLDEVCQRTTDFAILHPPRPGKRLLVLDLDYTLVDTEALMRGETTSSVRPYLTEMLANLYPYFDICVWSQTHWRWVEAKLTELHLLSDPRFQISFVLDRTAMPNVRLPGPWPPPKEMMDQYAAIQLFDLRTAFGEAKKAKAKLFRFLRAVMSQQDSSKLGSLYNKLVYSAHHYAEVISTQQAPRPSVPADPSDMAVRDDLRHIEAEARDLFATFWDAVSSYNRPAPDADKPSASEGKARFIDQAMSLYRFLVHAISAVIAEENQAEAAESLPLPNPTVVDPSTTPANPFRLGLSPGPSVEAAVGNNVATSILDDQTADRHVPSTSSPCPRTNTPDARATKRQKQSEGDPSAEHPMVDVAPLSSLAGASATAESASSHSGLGHQGAREFAQPARPYQAMSRGLLLQNLDKLADAFEHAVRASRVRVPTSGPPPAPAASRAEAMDVDVPVDEAGNSRVPAISTDVPSSAASAAAPATSSSTPTRPVFTAEALGLGKGLPRVTIPTALLQGETRGRERAPRERERTSGAPSQGQAGPAGPQSTGAEAPVPPVPVVSPRRPKLKSSSASSRYRSSPSRGRTVRPTHSALGSTSISGSAAATDQTSEGSEAKRATRPGSSESSKAKKISVKPLELIWRRFGREQYSERNTIHVDDIARNFALNPRNGVLVRGYHHSPHFDTELVALERYCLQLAHPSVGDMSALDHTYWRAYRGPLAGRDEPRGDGRGR